MASDDPSTRFPFINLEKAVERARLVFDGDRSGKAMPVLTAFDLWGYSPKSSGGFQTIGALRGYGLIDVEGTNADRKVKLTAAAKHYFLDERDDVRFKMLTDFALMPPLFRALWEKDGWSEGIPADTVARSHLKIERHLNDQSARAILSIFKDNIVFAGLRGSAQAPEPIESKPPAFDPMDGLSGPRKGRAVEHPPRTEEHRPRAPEAQQKAILFDMETLTVSATFDNVDDLNAFIEKLQKIAPLMPTKH